MVSSRSLASARRVTMANSIGGVEPRPLTSRATLAPECIFRSATIVSIKRSVSWSAAIMLTLRAIAATSARDLPDTAAAPAIL